MQKKAYWGIQPTNFVEQVSFLNKMWKISEKKCKHFDKSQALP